MEAKKEPTPTTPTTTAEVEPKTTNAVETQEKPKEPLTGKADPLLAALFRDFAGDDEEKEIKPVPVEAEPPKAVEPVVEAAVTPPSEPAAAEPATAKPAKKRKSVILDEPEVVAPTATQAEPAPAPVVPEPEPAKAADPDADYIAGLNDEQRDELEEAEWAEKNMGDKFKGRRKQLLEWYRKVDAAATENPERTLDENDAGFQAILKAKPAFDKPAAKKIILGMAEERATAKMKSEIAQRDTEIEDIKRDQKATSLKPHIDTIVSQWGNGVNELLATSADEKDAISVSIASAAKAIKETPDAIPEDIALEATIVQEVTQHNQDLARDYALFSNGATKFNPRNEKHRELLDFINAEGEALMTRADLAKARVRTNSAGVSQTFLSREKYAQLVKSNPGEASKHWTFGHRDVLEMIAYKANSEIRERIKAEEDWAKKRGLVRAKRSSKETPIVEKEAEPISTPKSKPTAAKGPGSTQPSTTEKPMSGINVVSALRMRD